MIKRKKKFRFKIKPTLLVKIVVPIVVLFIVIGLVGYFTIYVPYANVKAKGTEVMQSAEKLKDVF